MGRIFFISMALSVLVITTSYSQSTTGKTQKASRGIITLGANTKIARIEADTSLPASAAILAKGQVVSVDRGTNQISLRDTNGNVALFAAHDSNALGDISEGDQIQIYR